MQITSEINEIDKRGHKPKERRCIAKCEVRERYNMIRFVTDPTGVVVPDILGKLPGRGVWVSSDSCSLSEVISKSAFSRSFKSKVKVLDDLLSMTESLLSRRVLGLVTMARKAGSISIGFDQVQSMAREAEVAIRIEASDGSEDGRGKIRTLSKAMNREYNFADPIVVGCFSSNKIGEALSRESIVHAGIKRGKLAKTLTIEVKRLSGFIDLVPMDWPDREHEIKIK